LGLFSFIGGLLGGGAQKKASRAAEAAQLAYAQKALDQQNAQFQQTRSDFMPFQQAGVAALGQQTDILGLNGATEQQTELDALKASPLYQMLFRNGEETVLQNAAATGGIRGGNTQRSLADFGADTFAQTIQQQLQNLGGLSGQGLSASGQVGAFGAQNSAANSQLLQSQGAAKAGGALTRGGISAGMFNSAGGFADSILSAITGGGGGIGGIKF
jgi:hypothetical protein